MQQFLFFNTVVLILSASIMFKCMIVEVALDTALGFFRALRDKKFNSSAGIDGAIRKTAMLISVCCIACIDAMTHFNFIGLVPTDLREVFGITAIGLCDFFCLIYMIYEAVSITKNWTLLGLPVFKGTRPFLEKVLYEMTDEMPDSAMKDYNISVQKKKETRQKVIQK